MVGSRGFEPRSARSERAASAVAPRAEVAVGSSGWTRTTTTRVKGPACCVDTTEEHGWSEWRDLNPHLKAWKARRRPLPHIRPRSAGMPPRPNVDRCRSPAHRCPSVFKDPTRSSWRQRQDSNPDPRGLEARMLPLHHAADRHLSQRQRTDTPSLRPDALPFRVSGQNKKGLPGDRPRRPVSR
jgi:hypothetical protein